MVHGWRSAARRTGTRKLVCGVQASINSLVHATDQHAPDGQVLTAFRKRVTLDPPHSLSCRVRRKRSQLTPMGRRFPIPREDLPKLRVSQQERNDGKELMAALLVHTLREFEEFAYDHKGVVDAKRWKPQYSHDDMSMYRERDVGVTSYELNKTLRHCNLRSPTFSCTEAALTPATVMLTGWGPGRVEDAMSAVVTESQQDLSLVVTYMHQDVADCAVVHTMEHPSDDAPYHYLGYKYFVKRSPTNALVVKHRDSLYLEYCGMTQTRTSETLGFHLMQSVDIAAFPDLTGHNSIRALQSSRYLYRQKSDRVVEVFMLGNMNLSGMIVKPIASLFSAGAQFGVTRLLDLAEVRRLTDMARNRRRYRDELLSGDLDQSCSQYSSASTYVTGDGCSVCNRGKPNKLAACHLCGQSVCPRCRSAKRVWVSDSVGIMGSFRKIQACSKCVMRANIGTYEPPVERVRSQRSHQSSVSTNPSDGDPTSKSAVDNATAQQRPGFDGVLYEEPTKAARRQQSPRQAKESRRRKTKTPPTPETPAFGRSFVHQGATVRPHAAEIAVLCTSPEFEVPNRPGLRPPQSSHESRSYSGVTNLSKVDDAGYSKSVGSIPAGPEASRMKKQQQTSDGGASDPMAMMTRLMELTSMAEATSYRTQANGAYLTQQMQQQFKVQTAAGWRK
ncbi:hypothetical protein PHYPSEUDO_002021 [Phytophthora pseudosyringae]|uniref:FYVE-type domain-containing protein n=1 Tax=Phytophthora pseudosyringae TaxID=221518 RepID=A0A8T1VYE9_9STRA|nr:hypothetical protein PHYPSEUDO_002021 [Phytophthora pseudosyringae]